MRADDRRLGVAAIVLFIAARVPLLYFRQPFFDELFTRWISAHSFAGILAALRHDSGPPLYYLLVSLIPWPRALSLLFAGVGLAALLWRRQYAAAALLAVFPPAVLFAVDGRSYALCAMFVTLAVLAITAERPYAAALSFVLAAYSHYYGVLFFPLVRQLRPALLYLLFVPGLWLALHQPRAAMAWMHPFSYPDALFARPPVALIAAIVLLVALRIREINVGPPPPADVGPPPSAAMTAEGGGPTKSGSGSTESGGGPTGRAALHPSLWIIPYVLSIPIYVPLRFESVVATPLMQWLSGARKWVYFALGACFATWTAIGIVEHASRPPDEYQEAALRIRDAREDVVASGYLYLYSTLQRPVTAFPREQAEHPGWRATATEGSELPRGTFLWIGERGAPELSIIRQQRRAEPVWANARAMIVRVGPSLR